MDDIISRTGNERKYFINLSDGQPAFSSYNRGGFYYSGEPALAHTARQVQLMRDAGVKVLSYFISYNASTYGSYGSSGYDQSAFKTMYGQDASFIDPKSIPSIAMTLNKLFLE
jgi:nitric oxide reductase activation protein